MNDFIRELYRWADDVSTINERTWRHQCIMRTIERMQTEALEQEDEANVVEGSIIQPVTDKGRLLK